MRAGASISTMRSISWRHLRTIDAIPAVLKLGPLPIGNGLLRPHAHLHVDGPRRELGQRLPTVPREVLSVYLRAATADLVNDLALDLLHGPESLS